ncbi:phage tail sheath N-terminal beta-sandwich domain-containing protein [Clostridioides difficile]
MRSIQLKYFGYDYTHEKLKGLRDLFKNIRLGYFYKLNKGVKASCTIATAKYSGIRGNDLKVTVTTNIDDNAKFDVVTLLDNKKVDTQIAKGYYRTYKTMTISLGRRMQH